MTHFSFRAAIRALLPVVLITSGARAQTTVCRAASDDSEHMLNIVRQYALASDASWRAVGDSLRIPAASSSAGVVLITKENTCKSANTAYQGVATGARQTLSGRVYVVQVGTTYVVWDPGYMYNGSSPKPTYMVFDSRWKLQSVFVS